MTETADKRVTPLKVGAMIDASGLAGPGEIDIGLVRDTIERFGAVLIRGGARTRQDFVDLTERFGVGFMEYVGGANNDRASAFGQNATVLTVTGGNVEKQAIPLHGEMFYTKPRPATLFFGCMRPADADGQTTVCDGVAFWNALPEEIRALFSEKKLSYRRIYTDDTWKKTYKTDDIERVKALCAQNGVEFIDRGNGHFETLHISWAWADHRAGRAFINSLLVWAAREHLAKIDDSKVRFEDGTPMTPELLYKIHAVGESQTLNIPWEPGMVAVVDNTRVMHGRRAYEDSKRDIIMRLSLDPLVAPPLAAE